MQLGIYIHYAKSGHLYLQTMEDLDLKMSEKEFKDFSEGGFFTVRRTEKFWDGVWSDMTIEQVLMRSMKTTGGLTHGRGLSESTLSKWVSSIPATLPFSEQLEMFCGVKSEFSEQHVELRDSRLTRDNEDFKQVFEWFSAHSPFDYQEGPSDLVSLSTGLIADKTITCDIAEELGEKCITQFVGKNFEEMKFKRADKVKTFDSILSTTKINNNEVDVNPTQLFNRIICAVKSEEELKKCFQFELHNFPPSLFSKGILRKGTKSALQDLFPQTRKL